jgi:Spy/CpxP family protein refolding chaperone
MIQFGNGKLPAWRALLMAGILVAGCCALCVPASGQGRGGTHQRGGGGERELSELTQVLGLSVDQQAQVKTLLDERRAKMEALRSGGTPPSREQMEGIRKDTDAKIAALLNDDQKAKFAAWQQQRMERRRGQGGGDAPAAQPPGF